jgi:hypothetical protein
MYVTGRQQSGGSGNFGGLRNCIAGLKKSIEGRVVGRLSRGVVRDRSASATSSAAAWQRIYVTARTPCHAESKPCTLSARPPAWFPAIELAQANVLLWITGGMLSDATSDVHHAEAARMTCVCTSPSAP